MVNATKEASDKTRHDIVQAAGRRVRALGLGAASVAGIAEQVGLTHGAVYRHFPSKDALAGAAITADFERIVQLLTGIADAGGSAADYVAAYLSPDHRDHFPWGCPAAPLAAEISRSSPEVQQHFVDGLRANLAALARLLPDTTDEPAEARAVRLLSTLVGALALARATKQIDPVLSDQFLQTPRVAFVAPKPRDCA
jgi:TetR/AcrR family transcriptional regulator, transcriptional repressor for nem operon